MSATIYKLANDVSVTDVDDEVVLLDLKSGQYFGLDSIAAEIFKHLLEQLPLADISERLANEYDTAASTIQVDTTELIKQLLSMELIEEVVRADVTDIQN